MKRIIIPLLCSMVLVSGCGFLSKSLSGMDSQQLASAAGNAMTALTITDAQIEQLSVQSVAYLDEENEIDKGDYQKRLQGLMAKLKPVEGLTLNVKVYKLNEVNAFACGDGSIRVYSGLMDVMDDAELIAIIGHEIGHVVHKDTKTAMRKAYLASAARDVVSAAGGVIGTLSRSVVGDLAESFLSAQFSQKQEYEADEYGYQFAVANGYDKYSMYNALNELLNLSQGAQSSRVEKMFSSHPGTPERAAKVKEMADSAE